MTEPATAPSGDQDRITTTAAQRRCPWCRQHVRPVKVGDRLVYPVHSRFLADQPFDRLVDCSGSGEEACHAR